MRFPSLLPVVLLVLAGPVLAGCEAEAPESTPAPAATPTIPFDREGTLAFVSGADTLTTIAIEIADTDSARQRGLMERTSLPDASGMLFIFEQEEPQGFWMANTPLSLDILYVGADSGIVSMAKYTTPYSDETLPSAGPAQYVVEVPAGFADRYGIVEGDRVTWTRE